MGRTRTPEDTNSALFLISESVDRLAAYVRYSEDSSWMEGIMNQTFKNQLGKLTMRVGGIDMPRYGQTCNDGALGSLWIGRANNPDPHCMDISYCPSPRLQGDLRYLQRVIGVIYLKKSEFGMAGNDCESEPKEIITDTIDVLESWGLKRTKFVRSLQE